MIKKICYSCKKEKAISLFYKNKGKKFGVENQCKDCSKIRAKISSKKPSTKKARAAASLRYYYRNREELLRKEFLRRLNGRTVDSYFDRRKILKKNVTYGAIHKWVRKNFGKPKYCEECNKTGTKEKKGGYWNIQWANISGDYKRDRNDWRHLCRSCHKKYDNLKRLNKTTV